jgi:hypothetical protein
MAQVVHQEHLGQVEVVELRAVQELVVHLVHQVALEVQVQAEHQVVQELVDLMAIDMQLIQLQL